MTVSNLVLFFLVCICLSCSTTQKVCTFTLNYDVKCRTCDVADERRLIESFNIDTNELRLFVTDSGRDIEILHPDGYVTHFEGKIDTNVVKFDPSDDDFLLVNGEKFRITPIDTHK